MGHGLGAIQEPLVGLPLSSSLTSSFLPPPSFFNFLFCFVFLLMGICMEEEESDLD